MTHLNLNQRDGEWDEMRRREWMRQEEEDKKMKENI